MLSPGLQAILFGSTFYPGATLALDFLAVKFRVPGVNSSSPDFASLPGLTVTRATPAVSWDTTGTYSFAANVARIVPGVGLLVEEARTNLFLNSFAPATQTVTITAQSYTITVWGTGSVTVAAGTATISNAGSASAGSPRTIGCTVGGTITVTVTGSPSIVQVEAGAFGTSPIPTLGSSVTRAADSVNLAALNIPAPFSVLLVGSTLRAGGDLLKWGTLATGGGLYAPTPTANAFIRTASVTAANVGSGTLVAINTVFKTAARFAALDNNIAVSGVAAVHDTSATPSTFDQLLMGSAGYNFNNPSDAVIQKVIIYPRAFSDAELQAAST